MKSGKKCCGKGLASEMLPSRHALATITKGDPMQRRLGNYAKKTPTGAGGMGAPNLNDLSRLMR